MATTKVSQKGYSVFVATLQLILRAMVQLPHQMAAAHAVSVKYLHFQLMKVFHYSAVSYRIRQKFRQEKFFANFASGRQWRKIFCRKFSPTVNFDTLKILSAYNY